MFKLLFRLALLALLVAPIAFAVASFQPDPVLPPGAALTPREAAQSRALVKRTRDVMQKTEGQAQIAATRAELDGLIATAARAFPSLRGRTEVTADGLTAAVAAQVPGVPQLGWVNLELELGPSAGEVDLRRLRLGRMEIPPGLAVPAVRTLLDWATAEDIGTLLLASVERVETAPGRLTVTVDTGGTGDGSLFSRVVAGVRDATGLSGGEAAAVHYRAMAEAAEAGALPRRGSVAPWLRFAMERAAEAGGGNPAATRRELQAALLALAAHCGDRKAIETLSGGLDADARSACAGVTLSGRDDTRKHFTLSAAIAAAGGAGLSFGFGEVKELVDAGRQGGSGFSFDDIAADRAGIAWAEALAAAPDRLPELIARMGAESAVMPSMDGLPSFMSEAEFKARFEAVDSPPYRAQIAEIDARIAALPFHAR